MTDHPFAPIFDECSRILILGSFPSVRSRSEGFYYGHPRNRFWTLMSQLYDCTVGDTIDDKVRFLHENRIALYDVCASCEIENSADSSIKSVVPTDLAPILATANIVRIFTNGATADNLYRRHQLPLTGVDALRLPSTSPANAACSLERLVREWRQITI